MKRADLETHAYTFIEECVKAGPCGRRFGMPTALEFPVFQRLPPLPMEDMVAPIGPRVGVESYANRGAFRFGSNPAAMRASFTLSAPGCGLVACEVSTIDLAWKRRAVVGKPVRGTVAGARGWVVKIPLQAPRVYRHRGAAKQAQAYWQVAVHDGRLDRHEWRQIVRKAVGQLIRVAETEGVFNEAR